jgi:hypothetical protein
MNYTLHAHSDIEDAAKWYKIPLVMYDKGDIYIIQEDRCVFVGNQKNAEKFLKNNDGKFCNSRFPLV